jgi:hypothetical protein
LLAEEPVEVTPTPVAEEPVVSLIKLFQLWPGLLTQLKLGLEQHRYLRRLPKTIEVRTEGTVLSKGREFTCTHKAAAAEVATEPIISDMGVLADPVEVLEDTMNKNQRTQQQVKVILEGYVPAHTQRAAAVELETPAATAI